MDLGPEDLALCSFAEKLTLHADAMEDGDIEALRDVGLSDSAVHDAVQVIGYFNYINRVAAAIDTDLEPEMPTTPAWDKPRSG